MQTVVETPSDLVDAERLFSLDERKAIVDRLASDPTCGVVIPGGGGIRKVRFGFGARGKSGGARIVYLFSGANLPVFILAAFAKNEKANLSATERNALGKMVAVMIEDYRRRR
jgi:RelE toxin of RelE / RelB toxin-antitoxin system